MNDDEDMAKCLSLIIEKLNFQEKLINQIQQELKEEKTRSSELESVIEGLLILSSQSFGILLKHLNDPDNFDRDQTSSCIQTAYFHIFYSLKEVLRDTEQSPPSNVGFDRIYQFYEALQSKWELTNSYLSGGHPDYIDNGGAHLINGAADMFQLLDLKLRMELAADKESQAALKKAQGTTGPNFLTWPSKKLNKESDKDQT